MTMLGSIIPHDYFCIRLTTTAPIIRLPEITSLSNEIATVNINKHTYTRKHIYWKYRIINKNLPLFSNYTLIGQYSLSVVLKSNHKTARVWRANQLPSWPSTGPSTVPNHTPSYTWSGIERRNGPSHRLNWGKEKSSPHTLSFVTERIDCPYLGLSPVDSHCHFLLLFNNLTDWILRSWYQG